MGRHWERCRSVGTTAVQLRVAYQDLDTVIDTLNQTERIPEPDTGRPSGMTSPERTPAAAPTSAERHLIAVVAAHISWANTTDRTARTAPGRRALDQKFLDQADGDPVRAEHLRKAHFANMALKSIRARRQRRGTPTS